MALFIDEHTEIFSEAMHQNNIFHMETAYAMNNYFIQSSFIKQ
jgi:hypothetical protein